MRAPCSSFYFIISFRTFIHTFRLILNSCFHFYFVFFLFVLFVSRLDFSYSSNSFFLNFIYFFVSCFANIYCMLVSNTLRVFLVWILISYNMFDSVCVWSMRLVNVAVGLNSRARFSFVSSFIYLFKPEEKKGTYSREKYI